MLKSKYIKVFLGIFLALLLTACGTSSDSANNATASNQLPIANAGEDKQINLGTTVILDASKSSDDSEIVSYSWSLNSEIIGKDKNIVLDNLAEGTYLYLLTVTDDENATSTDTIEIRTYSDHVVQLQTKQGNILLKMMSDIAPNAVKNFTTHSKNAYYDGVIFHRVIKDFMIQGGDPTGTGRGGESIWGEYFSNEISPNVLFDKPFLLAMANAGGTKTNGSQFFITTKEASFLNGNYTIFGEVIEGTQVVTSIENTTTNRSDKPNIDQTIIKATLYFETK